MPPVSLAILKNFNNELIHFGTVLAYTILKTTHMEFLNRIELKGLVGSVKVYPVGDLKTVSFSVVTEYAYTDRESNPIVDCTWHSCVAWTDKCPDAEKLKRSDIVHVKGRLRVRRYIGEYGHEVTSYEVMVQELEIIPVED